MWLKIHKLFLTVNITKFSPHCSPFTVYGKVFFLDKTLNVLYFIQHITQAEK